MIRMKRVISTGLIGMLTASILMLSLFFAVSFEAKAAEATLALTVSASSVSVGSTVTVTVKCTSSSDIGYIKWNMSYPVSKLEHIPGSGESKAAGKINVQLDFDQGANAKDFTLTYQFKTLAVGSAEFTISDLEVYRLNPVEGKSDIIDMAVTNASVNITEKSKSSDASLASITPSAGTLNPAFSKTVYNYTVNVDASTDVVYLPVSTTDKDAAVAITGADEFLENGDNIRVITVTAPDGTIAKYTVNIYREKSSAVTQVPTEQNNATPEATEAPEDPTDSPDVTEIPTEIPTDFVSELPSDGPTAGPATDSQGNVILGSISTVETEYTIYDIDSYLKNNNIIGAPEVSEFYFEGVQYKGIPTRNTSENTVYIVYAKASYDTYYLYTIDIYDGSMQRYYGDIESAEEDKDDTERTQGTSWLSRNFNVVVTVTGVVVIALAAVAVAAVVKKSSKKNGSDDDEFSEEF